MAASFRLILPHYADLVGRETRARAATQGVAREAMCARRGKVWQSAGTRPQC